MATLPRSSIIQPGDIVQLRALFRGSDGLPADLDSYPKITIIQPSNNVVVSSTSAGVYQVDTGTYGFDYSVGLMPPVGTWVDRWEGVMLGMPINGEFTFTVYTTQLPAVNTDGYVALGDDPGFNYSQNAIININLLLKSLRARLKNSGKHKTTDEFGNKIVSDCDIFSTDELVTFLAMALSMFNEIPMFTLFTFEDTPIIDNFHAILVQGASIIALSSQALIERGREFAISDNGIGFTPPTISDILNGQYNTELTNWYDKVKMIKHNMRANPLGLGGLRVMGTQPAIMRLRHLRAKQIY